MKIIKKATDIEFSPSIHQYIDEKIGGLKKFLKRFDQNLVEVRVEVGKAIGDQRSGDIFRAEVNLRIGGDLLRAEQTAESLNAAIDMVRDELAREIKHYKEKELTQSIRGARSWKKFWQISPLARFRDSKVGRILRRK